MGFKDDFVSNIKRNEIRHRKKEKKTKGIGTIIFIIIILLNFYEC